MALVSPRSDNQIKIRVFVPTQDWLRVKLGPEKLRSNVKPWKKKNCEGFDLWSNPGLTRGILVILAKKRHFRCSNARTGCTTSLYMFLWFNGEKMIFLGFLGSSTQIKGGQNTISTHIPQLLLDRYHANISINVVLSYLGINTKHIFIEPCKHFLKFCE